MSPDDPRHGKYAGHVAGCREDCCTTAARNYQKRRVHERKHGQPREIDSTGTVRRIQALRALGWPLRVIAAKVGTTRETLQHIGRRGRPAHATTAAKIARVYEQMSMTHGFDTRARNYAAEQGWALPIQWDESGPHDIDDPNAEPYRPPAHKKDGLVDEVIVARALNGQRVPDATVAERFEIVRRWQRDGRALNELERIQHWHARRYTGEKAA